MNSKSNTIRDDSPNGYPLPTVAEMIVPTFVLARKDHKARTSLVHVREEAGTDKAIELNRCHTGYNSFHLQSQLTQSTSKHASDVTAQGNNLRCSETIRQTQDPETQPNSYLASIKEDGIEDATTLYREYNYTKVVSGREKLGRLPPYQSWVVDEIALSKSDGQKARVLNLQIPSFRKLKLEEMRSFFRPEIECLATAGSNRRRKRAVTVRGISRPSKLVSVAQKTIFPILMHHKAAEKFIEQSKVPVLVDKGDVPIEIQPVFTIDGAPLLPGSLLHSDKVPLRCTRRSNQIIENANCVGAHQVSGIAVSWCVSWYQGITVSWYHARPPPLTHNSSRANSLSFLSLA